MSGGSIYKIDFPNGKHYIGITTTSLEQRKREHKYCGKNGDTKCLYKALRKYEMVDTFELVEIDTADTLEELCEKEIRYIQDYKSYYMDGNGYNMTLGGEGNHGYVYTEEVKQKMSEMCKKYWENPEAGKEHSEKRKKYFENNPEARKEHSERLKQYYENNPEAIKKASEKSKKQWENPEARKQMSEITKKYFNENPEKGEEHSAKMKQYYKDNLEEREKMSKIKKKYYEETPGAREKCSESQKKRFENPEEIKKHSDILKKYYENNTKARKQMSEKSKKQWENPEARKQMSEIKKKYFNENPEARQKILDKKGQNKPFDVFTKNGTFVKTFNYMFQAREYLQKEHHITSFISIAKVLNGDRTHSAGFVFKYQE